MTFNDLLKFLCFPLLLCWSVLAFAQHPLDRQLAPYLKNGQIVVATENEIVYQLGPSKHWKMASLTKFATALAALHYLGEEFQYTTDVFLIPPSHLSLRGHGDPMLISERWPDLIAGLLKSGRLPETIGNLYLDDSLFDIPQVPGAESTFNPYDARPSALVTNFNTAYVQIHPSGKVTSAESQTPITPLVIKEAASLPSGKHRINLSQQREKGLRYVGELMNAFLKQHTGKGIAGEVLTTPPKQPGSLIYQYQNPMTLLDTIEGMMRYSNNVIANQLFLSIGLKLDGPPATLEKSQKAVSLFLIEELGISEKTFQIEEGSGLSPKNQMTVSALWKLLKAFEPHQKRLPTLQQLPVKTGTLTGVYNLAVYYKDEVNKYYVFIILNQPKNHRDRILSIIKDFYQ